MRNLESLRKLATASKLLSSATKQTRAQTLAQIARIEKEAGKHASYVAEKVTGLWQAEAPRLASALRDAKASAVTAQGELAWWSNKAYLLARASFDKSNAVADGQLRAARIAEFRAMPETLLKLHATSLRERGLLADLGVAHMVSIERRFETPIAIDDVEIPEQREALQLIREIDGYSAEVELLALEAGQSTDPRKANTAPLNLTAKLALARRIAAPKAPAEVRDIATRRDERTIAQNAAQA